jgi:EAL domain-containing protein (putative c-di-GMP-specific phosphodiesterase class I)
VERQLEEHGVPPSLLRLEVTESAVMGDPARAAEILRRLHELGVSLSIDDFGTGYTSMAYLRRLPVDELKVDRSFVIGMTENEHDAVLVRTAIDLGHNLGLTVVAEGVERAAHVSALRALECDVAQGYHYARPMPAADVTALLDRSAQATR